MSELKRTQGGRRTRATSETAVRDVAAYVLEGHVQQAGKGAKMRRWGRIGSGGFADEAHDIVTVSIIVDSGDP
jgi:hypothetical protein